MADIRKSTTKKWLQNMQFQLYWLYNRFDWLEMLDDETEKQLKSLIEKVETKTQSTKR